MLSLTNFGCHTFMAAILAAIGALIHGGFGCTIAIRSVPYSRRCVGSGQLSRVQQKNHDRNTILLRVESNGDREDFRRCLLGCGLPTFHVIFRESNTVLPRKSGHPVSPNIQVRITVVSGY